MKRKIQTVRQFAEDHPAFSEGGLRWLIFNEESNGLKESGAIIRVGRRVLIDEARFFRCLDEKNGIDAAEAA